jgi:hypothetical protein
VKRLAPMGLACLLLTGSALAEPVVFETVAWRSLDTGRSSTSVVVGDVDLDGDLDLVFGDTTGKIALYRNNFGRLTAPIPDWESTGGFSAFTKVVMGDLNGDGFPELVCGSKFGPLIVFWNSEGVYSSPAESLGPDLPVTDLALADLDNDHDLDLVVACNGAANRWLPNEGGVLRDDLAVLLGGADLTLALAVGDIDHDGWVDVFLVNARDNGDPHQVLFNRSGDLTSDVLSLDPKPVTPTKAALGDVSDDGLLDLVFATDSKIVRYINNGDLTFTLEPLDLLSGPVTDLAMADLDGDGLLDITCTTEAANGPAIWLRNLGGGWADLEVLSHMVGSTIPGGMTSLALGDLDEDGDLDFVGATGIGSAEAILWRVGGILETEASWPPTGSWAAQDMNWTFGLALVDIDQDNDLDVIQGRRRDVVPEANAIYINQGGVFGSEPDQWTATETFTNSLFVTDWDRDGDPDLLFGNEKLPVHLHRNQNGMIDPNPEILEGTGMDVWSLAAVDLDNDGRNDLVEGGNGELRISFRDAAGSGFRETHTLGVGPKGNLYNYLDFADLDSDGDLDFAAALAAGRDVVFRNNFDNMAVGAIADTLWLSPAAHRGGFISLKDINGDEHADLTIGYAGATIDNEWYLGDQGNFDELGRRWGGNSYPTWQVEMSDWNGDGFGDLLEAEERGPNRILGNRAGNIDHPDNPLWSSGDSTATFRLAAGDLDGDGDLDLWVGNKEEPDQIFRGVINPGSTNPDGTVPPVVPGSPAHLRRLSARSDADNRVVVTCETVDRESDDLFVLARCRPAGSTVWFDVESYFLTSAPGGQPQQLMFDSSAWPSSPGGFVLQMRSVEISRRLAETRHAPRYEIRIPSAGIRRPVSVLSTHGVVMPTLTEGGAARTSFKVTNKGNDILQIGGETSRADLELFPTTGSVAPGESLEFDLLIRPQDTVQHGQVYFASNDPLTPADTVMVTTDILALAFDFNFLLEDGAVAAPLGESLTGLLAPKDGVNVVVGWLWYRPAGTDQFTALSLSPLEKDFVAVIPGDEVTEAGIEYFLEVRNGQRQVYDPAIDWIVNPRLQVVESPDRMTSLVQAHSDAGILSGRDVFVRVVPPPGTVLVEGAVHYRPGGASDFLTVSLEPDSTARIPGAEVGERGLEYHVEAMSLTSILRDPPSGEHQIRVSVADLGEPRASGPLQYRMVSVPLDFGDFSGTIGDLVSDQPEFGPYDITRWRCFRYQAEKDRYGELSDPNLAEVFSPVPGKAFWLIAAQGNRLRTAPVVGRSVPVGQPFVVTVQPGWSQVGNPFAFPIDWAGVSVVDVTGTPADDLLAGPIAGDHSDLSVIQSFGGFWVKNLHDQDLQIHFPPVAHVEDEKSGSPLEPLNWSVVLNATNPEMGVATAQVAVAPLARTDWDPLDRPLPPMAPDQKLEVYLTNTDWDRFGGQYARDVRPASGEGHTWRFSIDLTRAGSGEVAEVDLTFANLSSLPGETSAVLFDRELQQGIPVTGTTRYSLLAGETSQTHGSGRFLLAVGTQEYLDQAANKLTQLPPTRTLMMQNAPNPFNPSTVISYELAREGLVRLVVYDLRGQLVRELVSERQGAGRYQVLWDGRDGRGAGAGAGVYFARLVAADATAITIKMILVK